MRLEKGVYALACLVSAVEPTARAPRSMKKVPARSITSTRVPLFGRIPCRPGGDADGKECMHAVKAQMCPSTWTPGQFESCCGIAPQTCRCVVEEEGPQPAAGLELFQERAQQALEELRIRLAQVRARIACHCIAWPLSLLRLLAY